jgi:hypothetical protein
VWNRGKAGDNIKCLPIVTYSTTTILVLMIVFVITILFGCDSRVAFQGGEQKKMEITVPPIPSQESITPKQGSTTFELIKEQDPETVSIAESPSCEIPPKILNWSSEIYQLKTVDTSAEPGMKFGFVKCDKGNFLLGDNEPGTFTVYSNGESSKDLIFIGKWGRALYIPTTSIGNSILITQQQTNGHLNLFINSVQPPEGSSSDKTIIKILFSRDMNQATLNNKTIQISEAKHSRTLTDLYQFNYDPPPNRVLTLHPKNNDFDFGSENAVTIEISGTIQDQTGKVMGSEYSWTFKTSN